jgi:prepilin-type processing-associated H-X9-DG protein
MKRTIDSRTEADKQTAFTQVELLVVVVVIAVLGMIGLAASAKLNNQTKIAQCSVNLRQLNLCNLLYAADNSDNLPRNISGSFWPWDVPVPVAAAMIQYGDATNRMYCPGTAPRFTDEVNFASANSLWNFGLGAGYRIIGYSEALANSIVLTTNQNLTVNPQPITIGATTILQNPSQRVLTADATLSVIINDGFTAISGGFTQNGSTYPHISPHLDGAYPEGGNVGMLDGHVEWRPFKQMKVRTSTAFGPYFYW